MIRELQDAGQGVDLNVVLDRLMNPRETNGGSFRRRRALYFSPIDSKKVTSLTSYK